MIVNMSFVVKRAIFISNNFLNLNVSVHNGTFIRRELPYQIGRQLIIEKEKMMKIQNDSYASEKPEKIPVNYILAFFITIFFITWFLRRSIALM